MLLSTLRGLVPTYHRVPESWSNSAAKNGLFYLCERKHLLSVRLPIAPLASVSREPHQAMAALPKNRYSRREANSVVVVPIGWAYWSQISLESDIYSNTISFFFDDKLLS